MRAVALALLALLSIGSARAEDYEKGDSITLSSDKAYFLVRVFEPKGFDNGPVLTRLLSDDELRDGVEKHWKNNDDDQEPNVLFIEGGDPFAETDKVRILLASAKPGRYVLAGVAIGAGLMQTCVCLGTVQFEAKAGVITDLGTLLVTRDDRPSPIPELAKQVHGKSLDVGTIPVVLGIQPYAPNMVVPNTLTGFPRQAAAYRAFGPFPNYFGATIDRLVPVAGVLDYDKNGHVLDLRPAN